MKDLFELGKSALNSSPLNSKKKTRRITALTEINIVDEYRRANGVYELCKCMMDKPQPGKSYHILTGGNVDLIAHLRWLMLHWKKILEICKQKPKYFLLKVHFFLVYLFGSFALI